jgi:hypothetical protein
LLAPEFGEPWLPGVLAAGADPLSGDFGVAMLAPVEELVEPEAVPAVESPLLELASLSFFILRSCLRSARFCLRSSRLLALVSVFALVSLVVVSVLAPALALPFASVEFVFESTFALPDAAAGAWDSVALLSWVVSTAKALKEIAAIPPTITGKSFRIFISVMRFTEILAKRVPGRKSGSEPDFRYLRYRFGKSGSDPDFLAIFP